MNWSMMPLRAPTKAFSARWQARAMVASGNAAPASSSRANAVATSIDAEELSPAPRGTLPVEREIKSANAHAFLRQAPRHPHRVVAPVLAGGGGQRVRRIGNLFAHVFRGEQNPRIVARANGGDGAEIDGRRHDKPAAIVGVLANQIHAARRRAAHEPVHLLRNSVLLHRLKRPCSISCCALASLPLYYDSSRLEGSVFARTIEALTPRPLQKKRKHYAC